MITGKVSMTHNPYLMLYVPLDTTDDELVVKVDTRLFIFHPPVHGTGVKAVVGDNVMRTNWTDGDDYLLNMTNEFNDQMAIFGAAHLYVGGNHSSSTFVITAFDTSSRQIFGLDIFSSMGNVMAKINEMVDWEPEGRK